MTQLASAVLVRPTPASLPAPTGELAAAPVGVGILGASGYAGAELLRLLSGHPGAAVQALGSRQYAGQPLSKVWPGLPASGLVLEDDATDPADWLARGIEVVFSALPHGAFAARARAFLAAGLQVIDLSADFRLRAPAEYPRRYQFDHPAPELLAAAPYGLTEWCCSELLGARLVANPGCYATASLLAVLPVLAAGWWNGGPIVINALSGVSGAGRAAKLGSHFVEVDNSAAPYKVGDAHAHLGEIRQALRQLGGITIPDPVVVFNPHLVPMARGILVTATIPLATAMSGEQAQHIYASRYAGSPFVKLLDSDSLPETRHVRGSNRCDLAVRLADSGRVLVVCAAIDNLLKGAAGQAIQNWNRTRGWPETTGLPLGGWGCA